MLNFSPSGLVYSKGWFLPVTLFVGNSVDYPVTDANNNHVKSGIFWMVRLRFF
jgi:hypothetical protein